MLARLWDYAQSQRENFEVSGVGRGDNKRIDLTLRRSMRLRQLGDLEGELQARARDTLPAMLRQLGTTHFEPSKLELEIVAHGDGAFYARHRDTNVFSGPAFGNRRVISAVYYFHRILKSFSGGFLRIYAFAGEKENRSLCRYRADQRHVGVLSFLVSTRGSASGLSLGAVRGFAFRDKLLGSSIKQSPFKPRGSARFHASAATPDGSQKTERKKSQSRRPTTITARRTCAGC